MFNITTFCKKQKTQMQQETVSEFLYDSSVKREVTGQGVGTSE